MLMVADVYPEPGLVSEMLVIAPLYGSTVASAVAPVPFPLMTTTGAK